MNENYLGIIFALTASILWSITVTLIKPISQNVSPFLINPIKNSIGLILFFISFIIFDISLWYNDLYKYEYVIILFSGALENLFRPQIESFFVNRLNRQVEA